MGVPNSRKLVVVVPRANWREALKRLAARNGVSVSQFVVTRLAPLVEHELAGKPQPE